MGETQALIERTTQLIVQCARTHAQVARNLPREQAERSLTRTILLVAERPDVPGVEAASDEIVRTALETRNGHLLKLAAWAGLPVIVFASSVG